MNDDWVPVELPDNFDQMWEDMCRSRESRIAWCMLCNRPIRTEQDFIPGTNTHDCDAGRQFEAEHAEPPRITRCRDRSDNSRGN